MKPAWRLILHVLAWTVAIPVVGFAISLPPLAKTSTEADILIARGVEAGFVIWATLIYAHVVPSTSNLALRLLGFVAFFASLTLIGVYALGFAQAVVIVVFGL